MTFKTIKDYFIYVAELYSNSASNDEFIIELKKFENNGVYFLNKQKLLVLTSDDFKVVIKATYCKALRELKTFTPFQPSQKIAANISYRVLCGMFENHHLSDKQKEMFHKSMFIDLSKYSLIEKELLMEPGFIKDVRVSFEN